MKKLLLLLLIIPVANAEILISEIMYNPIESDTYNEYLELYNSGNESINLSDYTICSYNLEKGYVSRNGSLIKNETFILNSNSYALVTDGGSGSEVYSNFNVSNSSLLLHISSSSICGSLSNSGDTIFLNNNSIIYSPDQGANGDGNSLQLINNSWFALNSTPGSENIFILEENNSQEQNEINVSEECSMHLEIFTPDIFESKESDKYYLHLYCNQEDQEAEVEYSIEDLFGNEIRDERETIIESNENKSRSFTPPKLYGSEAYIITAEIIDSSCECESKVEKVIGIKGIDEEEPSQKNISKTIELKESETKENKKPTIEIVSFPKEVKQGESFNISFKITNLSELVTVYSYVYFSQQLASEGGWTGNRKIADSSEIITLENKIKDDAEPNYWNLKVKAVYEDKELETKENILVLERKNIEKNISSTIIKESEINRTISISKYLIAIIIVLISIVISSEIRNNKFFKQTLLHFFHGFSRNKRKNRTRSDKS